MPKLIPSGARALARAALCTGFFAAASVAASASVAQADDAVTLSAAYRGDFWGNVHGGVQTGYRYFDDLLLRVTVDTEQAFG